MRHHRRPQASAGASVGISSRGLVRSTNGREEGSREEARQETAWVSASASLRTKLFFVANASIRTVGGHNVTSHNVALYV